ncbi:hypothetical protein [Pseudomonas sp. PDM31]|uniref:hypothetical protein n=1 Tax=Pseudomonas sp. PDM31 TaxID=2854778 RepID=UPI001C45C755|nr:hypothetical protein [Pseudomonas sp. PDM31]MBV7477192.1 hypothetical protein [Pseudomonas sp. PDM31]
MTGRITGSKNTKPSKADVRRHIEALRELAEAGDIAARVALIELSVKLLAEKKNDRR